MTRNHRRVALIKDTLSARSGTTKALLSLATGFQGLGAEVSLRFYRRASDWKLIKGLLERLDYSVSSSPTLEALAKILQAPFILIFGRGAFTLDDSADFLSQFVDRFTGQILRDSDIVVFMSTWSAFRLLIERGSTDTKLVVLVHEPPRFREFPFPIRHALRVYVRFVLRTCDLVVAITEEVAKSLKCDYGVDSRVLYFGVTPARFSLSKKKYVLADTRWTEERDPFFLIDIALLSPEIEFVVCGSFPDRHIRDRFLERLKARGLSKRVHLEQDLDETQLFDLYGLARCYIRWSAIHGELGSPLGVFQALSCGCPPILSDDLGVAVHVSEALSPSLVVPRKPEAFSRRIRELFDDEGQYSDLMLKIAEYRQTHDWKAYAARIVQLCDDTPT